MKYFAIFTIFLFIFIKSSYQQIVPLHNDSIAIEFIVQVERAPLTPGGNITYLGTGTLLTFHHILTTRAIYQNVELPNSVIYRFRGTRVGEGFRAQAAQIVLHAQADIAIARMNHRVDQQFSFSPRNRAPALPQNRFCTLYGFNLAPNEQNLMMTPIVVRTGAEHCGANGFLCANGVIGQFPVCGGLLGAAIICDGNNIAGLVTTDNFCVAINPRINMLAVNDFQQWINDQTAGGAKGNFGKSSLIGAILSVFLIKIFM
ncbi:hypothetical protein PVAND_015311 [Polypedilum vanderplanki]|uniref:Peptidase S1 domain-containing protein n=1 Tax=Polypedilum vanderplanki TaxID=319348 RepID=A0A9J6BCE9_POLVA|nr:hypothetical protein PVAND_015311 [Polypedilum vanderplanki]